MLRRHLLAVWSSPLLAVIAHSGLAAGSDLATGSGDDARGTKGWTPAGALLCAAADGNRDDITDATEFSSWLARLTATTGGTDELDAALVHAHLLLPLLDRNGDAFLQPTDLARLHAERDANGDGTVDARELSAVLNDPERAGTGLLLDATFVAEIALQAGDSNEDDAVTRAEWDGYLTNARAGEHINLLRTALADVATQPAVGASAYSFAVYLETLDRDLDRDQDGHLTVAEVAACFADLDLDDDGAVDRAEQEPPARYTERTAPRSALDRRLRSSSGDDLRPPLIDWQRDLDDALAVSRASGRPLLICVNMDGEVACESLARGRYRDPEFARLTRGFVPLLASPSQHRDRGHDDFGRRLQDPRFGAILDREHQEIEPLLFARYFNRQRVAPRHVGVSPDGEILFDLYLLGDLSAIDRALREHGRPEADAPSLAAMDDQALLDHPSALHRAELEARFERRDDVDRQRLVEASLSASRETRHPEILRRGLRDRAAAVRQAAVKAVQLHADKVPLELLVEAFRVAGDDASAVAGLVDAAYAWASDTDEESVRDEARRLGQVFDALRVRSRLIDVTDWTIALHRNATAIPAAPVRDRKIQNETIALLAGQLQARTTDNALREQLAEASLDAALWDVGEGADPGYLFQDAQNLARRATAEGPPRPRALAVLAVASLHLGDHQEAGAAARQALPGLISNAADSLAANTLRALIGSLTERLYWDMREQREWPDETLTDLVAAHDVLSHHPTCTEADALQFLDLLGVLQAHYLQGQVARHAVARFPGSGPLHNYLRFLVLRDGGARALEAAYAEIDVRGAEQATWDWFTGLAGILAAERHVQDERVEEAVGAYQRAAAWMQLSALAEPTFADTAAHYVCIARAGEARLHLDARRTQAALVAVRQGLVARPDARSAQDGLGHMPVETAQQIVQAAYADGHARDAMLLERVLASFAN